MDTKSIRTIVAYSSATIGLTMGLYLYVYGPCVIQGLKDSGQIIDDRIAVSGIPFKLRPEGWALVTLLSLMLAIAFLEIPTGVLADVFGRKFATCVSFAFRFLFFACYAFCSWLGREPGNHAAGRIVWLALIANVCLGVHTTLRTGSFNAWVRDWLTMINERDRYVAIQSRGKVIQIVSFALGAFMSVFLYLYNLLFFGFVVGAVASLLCTVLMTLYMRENNNPEYEFSAIRALFTRRTKAVVLKATRILMDGLSYFLRDKKFCAVALLSTGAWSLFYFVDYYWVIIFGSSFAFLAPKPGVALPLGGSVGWVVLITVFALVSGFACLLFERRVSKSIESKKGLLRQIGVNPIITSRVCVAVALVYCAFLLLVCFLIVSVGGGSLELFVTLVVLLVVFKAFDGVLEVCLDGLENVFVPDNEQARATILSTFSLIRNALIGAVSVWLLYKEFLFGKADLVASIGWLWIGCCVFTGITGAIVYFWAGVVRRSDQG